MKIMIQNADRNMSARDYARLDGGLAVTSAFRTLQGEGRFSGWPAVFLRLAGCNYGSKTDYCQFCDTSFQFAGSTAYTIDELVQILTAMPGYTPNDILVITGGEPTLQYNVLSLISRVKANALFAEVQIETNGSQPKFFEEAEMRGLTPKNFVTVVSPKANERTKKYPPLHPTVQWWASDFKYVLSSDPESMHHTLPELALHLAAVGRPVYVSPMAVYKRAYEGEVSSIWDDTLIDREATAANYAYAARYAIDRSLRLSVQTHLFTAIP
jgi:organic radical activating enzyme